MQIVTKITVLFIVQLSGALFIPLFVPDTPEAKKAISAVFSGDLTLPVSPPPTTKTPANSTARFTVPASILGVQANEAAKYALAKVKPFFLYRSPTPLDLHKLNPQTAMKILSQMPPFSALSSVNLASVATVADLGQLMRTNTSEITEALASFLSVVDHSVLKKFNLLQEPVAAFVMDKVETSQSTTRRKSGKVFDSLAALWSSASSLPRLLHSTFCTYNEASALGYCMEITDNYLIRMSIFGNKAKKDLGNEGETYTETDSEEVTGYEEVTESGLRIASGTETESVIGPDSEKVTEPDSETSTADSKKLTEPSSMFEVQVLRLVQNKLNRVVNKIESQAGFLADDPLAFLDEIDERIDQKIDDTQRKLAGASRKLILVPVKIDTKIDEAINEQIQKLADSRLNVGLDEEYSRYYPFERIDDDDDELYQTSVKRDSESETENGNEIEKFDEIEKITEIDHEDASGSEFNESSDDIIIPLSLLLVGKNIPRPKLFRNVVQQSTSLDLKRREECVPVTWYNVFHHSVFGDYKFCD